MTKRLLILAAAAVLASGCASKSDAPTAPAAPPSQTVVQAAVASTDQKIKDIQNDPSIPEGQKQQIIARMQSNIARTIAATRSAAPPAPATQ